MVEDQLTGARDVSEDETNASDRNAVVASSPGLPQLPWGANKSMSVPTATRLRLLADSSDHGATTFAVENYFQSTHPT
jgi:hypothetical protein